MLNVSHKNVGGEELPSPYGDFLDFFSFLQLDFIAFVPFDCLYKSSFDHLDALLIETLSPLALLVLAYVAVFVHPRRVQATEGNQIFSTVMTMLLFVLPIISR